MLKNYYSDIVMVLGNGSVFKENGENTPLFLDNYYIYITANPNIRHMLPEYPIAAFPQKISISLDDEIWGICFCLQIPDL